MHRDAGRVIWGIVLVIFTTLHLAGEENKSGSMKGTIVCGCGREAVEVCSSQSCEVPVH